MSDEIHSALRTRLKHKLTEAGISVNALEKQAGLKRSAVQNIIHGKSKKPSADILFAITKVLGCPIQELLGQPSKSIASTKATMIEPTSVIEGIFNSGLYAQAATSAAEVFRNRFFQPTRTQALDFILEIYHYSTKSGKEAIDEHFAEWLFDKSFPHKRM